MASKGGFDVFFDNIKNILIAWSADQPAAEQYTVHPDSYRCLVEGAPGAFVCLSLGSITPDSQARQAHFEYNVNYYLDLVAIANAAKTETEYTQADEMAGIRMRYLIQQMILALFPSGNRNLGMPKGTVSKKPFFTIQPFPEELQKTEVAFAGTRLILTVGLAFDPEQLPGTTLEQINFSADKWSAIIKTQEES